MKSLGVSLLSFLVTLSYFQVAMAAPSGGPEIMLVCNKATIDGVYIPKLRTVADWTDAQLRPYAKQLCNLDLQKLNYQNQIKLRADDLRSNNWRVCDDLGFGPNPDSPGCKVAWANKINDLINHCINLVNTGHNPHNVLLFIDPAKVEVACLKGVNEALK